MLSCNQLLINNCLIQPFTLHTHTLFKILMSAILKLSSDKELVKKWEEDQEAMKGMQIRVGFNNKVRPIVVRVPGRMLLREAEVTVVEKRKKKKVILA